MVTQLPGIKYHKKTIFRIFIFALLTAQCATNTSRLGERKGKLILTVCVFAVFYLLEYVHVLWSVSSNKFRFNIQHFIYFILKKKINGIVIVIIFLLQLALRNKNLWVYDVTAKYTEIEFD